MIRTLRLDPPGTRTARPEHTVMRRRRRAAALLVMTLMLSMIAIVVAFFANTLGYQSAADIALRSALRSGGISAAGFTLPDGDPLDSDDDGFARYYIDPGVAATSSPGTLDPWLVSSGGAARRVVLLVLAGEANRTGSFANRFGPDIPGVLGRSTADLTREGLDVEVINPAVDANQSGCSSLNGEACSPAISCTPAGTYPAGITSELDGNCYTAPTVVLRIRIAVTQTSGTVMLVRTVASGAGTNVDIVP